MAGVGTLPSWAVEVVVGKPAEAGGTAAVRYIWQGDARAYRRAGLQVERGPVGGALVEVARAPARLQLEQMEALLQDAVAITRGEAVLWELGPLGRRFWRALCPRGTAGTERREGWT